MATPNVLKKFSSFNTIFTLAALSANEVNSPNSTYKVQGLSFPILRSGGGLPNKVTNYYEDQLGIKLEYFIDNVNIEALINANQSTRNSNATFISFNIIEPYSMGLFLQTLLIASKQAGWENYLDCPFILQIEFIGYDDNGNIVPMEDTLNRHIPVSIKNVEFDVNSGGSIYTIEGIPYNEQAMLDQIDLLMSDVTISGSNVAEILQDGVNSLSTVINNNLVRQQNEGKEVEADEVYIIFPNDLSSANNLGTIEAIDQNRATSNPNDVPDDVIAGFAAGTTASGVGSGTSAQTNPSTAAYIQNVLNQEGALGVANSVGINVFGSAEIIEDHTASGRSPMPAEIDTYQNDVYKRGDVVLDSKLRTFTYSQGTRITTIIEDVILSSKWGESLVDQTPDGLGFITWFKIVPRVFIDPNRTQQRTSGRAAKSYVYQVVPYKVHSSTLQMPSQTGSGYSALRNSVAKEYNYIYSGQNDDIINFDIKINSAFYTSLFADSGNKNVEAQTGATQDVAAQGVVDNVTTNLTSGSLIYPEGTTQTASVITHGVSSGQTGGSNTANSSKHQVAKLFNDTILNSAVDLLALDLEIFGDPYFLFDTGLGNYNSSSANPNINADGSISVDRQETDILINFRTPVDYSENGFYFQDNFNGSGQATLGAFSGLYRVVSLTNVFEGGKFTQRLSLLRRRNQEDEISVDDAVVQSGNLKMVEGGKAPYSPFDNNE
jgi:hypothetical protein